MVKEYGYTQDTPGCASLAVAIAHGLNAAASTMVGAERDPI